MDLVDQKGWASDMDKGRIRRVIDQLFGQLMVDDEMDRNVLADDSIPSESDFGRVESAKCHSSRFVHQVRFLESIGGFQWLGSNSVIGESQLDGLRLDANLEIFGGELGVAPGIDRDRQRDFPQGYVVRVKIVLVDGGPVWRLEMELDMVHGGPTVVFRSVEIQAEDSPEAKCQSQGDDFAPWISD